MNAETLEPGKTGRLIAVAGIDGAGKSTLATSLLEAFERSGQAAVLVGKHTTEVPMSEELSVYLDRLNSIVYRRKTSVGEACGDFYWLFALAAWYTLQDRLVIQPTLQSGVHVILDNAHQKILARYSVNPDVPTELARQVFAHLTSPDLILFLEVAPEEALRRKGEFTALEAGRTGETSDSFISYQDGVTQQLSKQAANEAWAAIDVASKAADVVLEEAIRVLSEQLGLQMIR